MKLKVIGVDPSLRNFGIVHAVVDIDTMKLELGDMRLVKSEDDAKKAKTVRKNSDDLRRASLLYEGFTNACKGAAMAFVEVPVGSQSARAMASYGICIGVLASCQIPMIQVMPKEVKLSAIGHSNASKDEMIEAALAAYPNAAWLRTKRGGKMALIADNEHLADATFAIHAGLSSAEFRAAAELMRRMQASQAVS